VKLHIKTSLSEFFYYPDVMVGCDPADSNDYFLEKPSILFEVLSPSTESIDRREKLLAYQTIPSLGHYVIVAQEERRVEWLQREGNSWKVAVLTRPEDRLEFPAEGAALSLAEIYEGIDFA
jgi:Uma2 family endonuclease